MTVEQIYTGCLAHGAYYIESDGEAVVVDPLREVQVYIDKARKDQAKIKYVLETHFHADFVSGHLDLARKTGAVIVYGPTAKPQFPAHIAQDGEELRVGKVKIKVLHTPGHTLESACYLLIDENNKPSILFSGDTLFIGDVGRPDLAQKLKAELTPELLAGYLFDSLHKKIFPLPDDIIVYPAHGKGSACGKNMSDETTDTLGHQKLTNYALQPNLSKNKFIEEVLSGLTPPPGYFPSNVLMNIRGYSTLEKVLNRGKHAFSPEEFEAAANSSNAVMLDTRKPEIFTKGFIPNSINIGIDGNFAPWVGTLIPDNLQQILLICDPGREEEVIVRLARVGYDNTMGYLNGGFDAWTGAGKEVDQIESMDANFLGSLLSEDKEAQGVILDVRRASEFETEHIFGAENIPLDYLSESMSKIDKIRSYYVHCAGGYRSVIFISILRARGYRNLINVEGGFKSIKESGKFKLTDVTSPETLL